MKHPCTVADRVWKCPHFEVSVVIQSVKSLFHEKKFYGDNEGLTMAEVELSSVDESFEKPDFIGRDVTGDRRFYNSSLRVNPFKDWKDMLPEYKK